MVMISVVLFSEVSSREIEINSQMFPLNKSKQTNGMADCDGPYNFYFSLSVCLFVSLYINIYKDTYNE